MAATAPERIDHTINEKRKYDDISKVSSCITPSCSSSPSPTLRANLYAQEMNNSAVACIEIGYYDRAITTLTRALKLYKRQCRFKDVKMCNYYKCTLDDCIVRIEEQQSRSDKTKNTITKVEHSADSSSAYISRRPIKIKTQGHAMGHALYLLIIFNLGLANHLIATNTSDDGERKTKIINSAIASYQLAYEMQTNILQNEKPSNTQSMAIAGSVRSIRFQMMILNNISQLYKLNQRMRESDACLRRLLSLAMMVVDQQAQATNKASTLAPIWRIDLEGFLHNTSSLILQQCYTAESA